MFEFIKKMFIVLLASIVKASSDTKCVSLSNEKCKIQPTLVNLHPNGLVIDVIKSLILLHSFPYFLIYSLFSLVGTSVKYLFLSISSKFPFTYMKIIYKGFALQIFTYLETLIFTYPMY